MKWTENDLKNLKEKGLKVNDKQPIDIGVVHSKIKIVKRSIEKDTIHAILDMFKLTNQIDDFVTELQFDKNRKFRFDFAIPSLMTAVEYEGIMSEKSRHTTISGYSKDIEKYNLATCSGWRILRYTAKNYLNLEKDLEKIITKHKSTN